MKPASALRVSLAVNIAMTAALVLSLTRKPAAKGLPVSQTQTLPIVTVQPPIILPAAPVAVEDGPVWQPWLQKLRAAGVPDDVIGGLVVADFQNRWEKKMSDVWRRYAAGEIDDDERAGLEAQHDVEQEKELKAALGNGFESWDKTRTLADIDIAKMNLSSSEVDTLYQLRKELARKNRDLEAARRNGEIDPSEFSAQQSAAQGDYEKQFKTLLGDARYAARQNFDDEAGGALRRSLKKLNLSDGQAETVSEIQSNWNAQRLTLDRQAEAGQLDPTAYERQLQAADAARDQEYQRVLGTNGLNQWQQVQDTRFQTLKQYAGAWQLSDADVDYVFRVIQYKQSVADYYQKQAQTGGAPGQSADAAKAQENMRQLSMQAEQAVNNYLGSDRYMKLKQNGLFSLSN
jgi:hypothetical protein